MGVSVLYSDSMSGARRVGMCDVAHVHFELCRYTYASLSKHFFCLIIHSLRSSTSR